MVKGITVERFNPCRTTTLTNDHPSHINDFTMRIGSSSNVLIATLRENSFILAGPLRQKWITSVYTIYN